MYRVKYSKLSFIADTLSFVALFAAILLAVLAAFFAYPWLYAGAALAGFVILKLISKKIMAIREMLPAVDDFEPMLTLSNEKKDPFDAAFEEADLVADELSSPRSMAATARPQKPIQQPPTQAATPQQPAQKAQRSQQIPVLDEIVEPPADKETAAHPATQFKCIFVDDEVKHQLSVTDFFDKQSDPESRYANANIDDQGFSLFTVDPLGEPMELASVPRQALSHIQCRRLRCVKLRRFKLFRFVAAGLFAGLLISLYLLWNIYFFHDALIESSYIVTTIIPVLAGATFAGLLVGILKPHKKIRYYTLYQVFSQHGCAIEFAVRCRHARRIDKKLSAQGWTPVMET